LLLSLLDLVSSCLISFRPCHVPACRGDAPEGGRKWQFPTISPRTPRHALTLLGIAHLISNFRVPILGFGRPRFSGGGAVSVLACRLCSVDRVDFWNWSYYEIKRQALAWVASSSIAVQDSLPTALDYHLFPLFDPECVVLISSSGRQRMGLEAITFYLGDLRD